MVHGSGGGRERVGPGRGREWTQGRGRERAVEKVGEVGAVGRGVSVKNLGWHPCLPAWDEAINLRNPCTSCYGSPVLPPPLDGPDVPGPFSAYPAACPLHIPASPAHDPRMFEQSVDTDFHLVLFTTSCTRLILPVDRVNFPRNPVN